MFSFKTDIFLRVFRLLSTLKQSEIALTFSKASVFTHLHHYNVFKTMRFYPNCVFTELNSFGHFLTKQNGEELVNSPITKAVSGWLEQEITALRES